MNGIEKITARIESEARAEAEVILAEAAEAAEEIRADYNARAQERYWEIVRSGVKNVEQHVKSLGSTAQVESRKAILAMKQEQVTLAFDKAQEMILEFPEDKYVEFLAQLADGAARSGSEELIFNEKDKEKGKEVAAAANALLKGRGISGKLKVSKLTRPILGGLIVKDGDIEVNCSIEGLAEFYRGKLSTQVAETMFD